MTDQNQDQTIDLTEMLTDEEVMLIRGDVSLKLDGKNIPSIKKVLGWAADSEKSVADHTQGHIDYWLEVRAKRQAKADEISDEIAAMLDESE